MLFAHLGLQCRIFKHAMKLEFADAAAAEVTEQLKKGVNGDKLHLDLGTTHLRDVSLGWILAA